MPADGFDATADEVMEGIRLDGRTVIVTGGSGGLGEETVRVFAAAGAHVVFTARDAARAAAAAERIRSRHPGASLSWRLADLSSLQHALRLGDELAECAAGADVLVANAGIMGGPLRRSAEGWEAQFATNYLSHYALIARLVPLLLRNAPSRAVLVSSAGHGFGRIDWDDLHYQRRPYQGLEAYGQSKTALILLARELDRRYRDRGLRAASVHPGGIHTELGRSFTPGDRQVVVDRMAERGEPFVYKSLQQGAATQVWASVVADPDLIGGRYLEDCRVAEVNPDNNGTGPGVRPEAVDASQAARLIEVSAGLTGVRLPD